jgi:hypothetical protein
VGNHRGVFLFDPRWVIFTFVTKVTFTQALFTRGMHLV